MTVLEKAVEEKDAPAEDDGKDAVLSPEPALVPFSCLPSLYWVTDYGSSIFTLQL